MLVFQGANSDIVVEFTAAALNHFAQHRQVDFASAEAGGQLFAIFDGNVARIEVATGPRRTDHRSRYSFRPDRRAEQHEIKAMFKRGLHYVGDWHTHPTLIPTPSFEDFRNIRAAVRNSTHQLTGFLLVVVGNAAFPMGLCVTLETGFTAIRLDQKALKEETPTED